MKKLFAFAALAFVCAASMSAWEHSAGFEISAPFFSVNTRGDGTKNIIEPQGTARYFGRAQNGFCVSSALNMGCAISDDFTLQGESASAKGFGMGLSLGAGYVFDITDRFSLAALGSFSLDWARFEYKKEISARVSSSYVTAEWTQTDDALFASLGAELLARFKLTDKISLVGSFAARFIDGGKLWKNGTNVSKEYSDSFELRGNFSLTPSLGASWTF